MTQNTSDEADNAEANLEFDVVVIGGGPAGLTTALYTTRLGHDTAIFNRGGGRAAMMQDTHNVLGVPESVSGNELLQSAIEQLEGYGAEYRRAFVTSIDFASNASKRFRLETTDGAAFADRVVLATGLNDSRPEPPLPRTGRGLHYCLHCDAYMFVDESVYVMGSGESAAHVAMILLNFTDDVDLLLREADPEWSDETDRQLRAHPVDIVKEDIAGVNNGSDGWLESLEFVDGTEREYTGGFAMYGAAYNNELAENLDIELDADGAVVVDDHGRTNRDGVYAVGDLTPGHNQIPVAMGQGAKAGLAIHKDLRTYPASLSELEGEIESADVPSMSDTLRSQATRRARSDD